MLHCCRICRTQHNLKYAPQQLLKIYKRHTAAENEIFGNICYECEERLLNFNKVGDGLDNEADSGREETPVIVDDDELLYNLFFEKMSKLLRQSAPPQTLRLTQPSSLGSDCDTEIIEVLTSRESTPARVDNNPTAVVDLEPDAPKRKRRKKYKDSELIVLAKFNLVSSDSEADEVLPPPKRHSSNKIKTESTVPVQVTPKPAPPPPPPRSPVPVVVKREVETTRDRVKCAVCQQVFPCNQRLVHHLRLRHRDLERETQLRERARHAHDSALTIRLCYQARYTYYECQLCGRIDCVYKDHKQHVIAQHSAELKSLKDPLLKQLQCPLCSAQCGFQYIELCRHLLSTHTKAQYKPHLKQVERNARTTTLSASRQREVERTARIFQFHKRQHWYFECRQCRKVCSSYFTHRQHVTQAHETQSDAIQKSKKQKVEKPPKPPQPATPPPRPAVEKKMKKGKQRASKKPIKKMASVVPLQTTLRKRKQTIVTVKPASKPKAPRKSSRKSSECLARVSVKVKPAVRSFPTLDYHCPRCAQSFKGFCQWNLHMLQVHSEHELQSCTLCDAYDGRQRRKRTGGACMTIDENSNAAKANCCKPPHKKPNNSKPERGLDKVPMAQIKENNDDNKESVGRATPTWLQELLLLSAQKSKTIAATTTTTTTATTTMAISSGSKMKPNTASFEQTYCRRVKWPKSAATYTL